MHFCSEVVRWTVWARIGCEAGLERRGRAVAIVARCGVGPRGHRLIFLPQQVYVSRFGITHRGAFEGGEWLEPPDLGCVQGLRTQLGYCGISFGGSREPPS